MSPRIGVIGVGVFGINHLRAFRQCGYNGDEVLVAACDIDETRLKKIAEEFDLKTYTDYQEMLAKEELDAVSIATPDHLHREIALNCAQAGKHLLVEKPMDITVEGCEEMIQAARENKVLLQVDFHKRFDPYHQEMERAIASGRLGEIQYGYAYIEMRLQMAAEMLAAWSAHSSPAWFLGIHFYDLARWSIKSNPVKVWATGSKKKLVSMGIDTFDAVNVKVDFENGVSVAFDSSWALPNDFEAMVNQGIRFVGTEGVMEVDTQNRGAESCFSGTGMATYNLGLLSQTVDKYGREVYAGYVIESILDFAYNVDFLKKGGSLEQLEGKYPSGEDGLQTTKIAAGAHRSLETGQLVEL